MVCEPTLWEHIYHEIAQYTRASIVLAQCQADKHLIGVTKAFKRCFK